MKVSNKKFKFLLCLLITPLLGIGCGGSSGDDNTQDEGTPVQVDPVADPSAGEPADARVVSISLDKPSFAVGDTALLRVDVTYAERRVLEGGERVVLVIKLPAGAIYQADSTGIVTENSSTTASPDILTCPDGESYVAYDLGSDELKSSIDPDGRQDADFELVMGVDGMSPTGLNILSAGAADNSLSYGCGKNFGEEASTSITVL